MLIVQLSDTHITRKGTKAFGIAPMAENLSLCVAHINQLKPKPDVALITGDISYSGDVEELKRAKTLLDKLMLPYFVIPGNHDDRFNVLSAFDKQTCPITDENQVFIQYVINDFPLRLIALDSTHKGNSGGKICEERALWLDRQLAKDREKPTIIFMHHPPLKLSVLETDHDGFKDVKKLKNIIKKYDNIERIVCGHVHLATYSQWQGTTVSTAPSTGLQLLLDLSMEQASQFLLEPPAYQLHHWTPDNNLVTHTIRVTPNQQSYLFEEQ